MPDHTQLLLRSLHNQTGQLLTIGSRLLAAVVVLGSLFCLFSVAALYLFRHPERVFQTQAFMLNYAEFAHANNRQEQAATGPDHLRPQGHQDPDWDGAFAGASIGLTLGRNIPLIGYVAGPVAGALIGYKLDSKI